VRQSLPALLPRRGVRDGAGRVEAGRDQAAHQRIELRALQDLRHRRSIPDHHMGDARGRRRAELQEPVTPNAKDGTTMKTNPAIRTLLMGCAGGLLSASAAGLLGCASTGFTPVATPMPSARASLQPEYRMFYDALADYGDWKLIQPFGYVFRPRVSFES